MPPTVRLGDFPTADGPALATGEAAALCLQSSLPDDLQTKTIINVPLPHPKETVLIYDTHETESQI